MSVDKTIYRHQSGLTLVELLITIAIVSVLATIAIPNIMKEMPKYRLNGATKQIVVDLMQARMKAVRLNRKVKIFFANNNQYKVCDDVNNDDTVDDCEGDAKVVNIQDNYSNIILSSSNNPIFNPRGTASNLATINLTNSSGTKSITVAITGRIQMN